MTSRHAVMSRHCCATLGLLLLTVTLGARPAPKNQHMGKQADGTGGWKTCQDVPAQRPTPIPLTAHFDATSHALTLSGTLQQATGVFGAAFAECFMEDVDQNKPPNSDYNQYHDTTLGYAVIRIRPAAQAHRMNDALLKENNTGYIVADLNVRAILRSRAFASRPLGAVTEDHSAVLWHGRDDSGKLYSAIIDLRNFPATSQATALSDVRIIASGGWIERPSTDKRTAAFARFTDPARHFRPHHGRHRTPRRGPSMIEDELTIGHQPPDPTLNAWVSCDPGCCGSMDLLVF